MIPAARIPTHPGEVLREEFLKPLGLTASNLAHRAEISRPQAAALLAGRLAVTPETARRLARALRTTPEYWLNLQSAHDACSPPVGDWEKHAEDL